MAARSRALNNILSDFPANPHENRFSAASRAKPTENLRSKSYHGKCVCDICTCGNHRCPPSASPNKYPSNMRSTSQDDFRAYKPKEIKSANLPLTTTKKPSQVSEPNRILPDKPEKGQFQTSSQKSYPNHWQKGFDPKQLRYPASMSAHRQSSDIFPREVASDRKLSPSPRTQRPVDSLQASGGIDPSIPAGVNTRGRTGDSQTPRYANDTSPDFPFNRPSYTQPHPHVHYSPHYATKETAELYSNRSEPELEERPSVDLLKTRLKPVKFDSRIDHDEALLPFESPNRTVKNVYDGFSRDEPPALPPRDEDNFDSNPTPRPFKKDRYGPRKGIPRPQTNQKTLVPQRQAADSPPKKQAEVVPKRNYDRNNVDRGRPYEPQKDYRPPKDGTNQYEEYQENRTPNRQNSRLDPLNQNRNSNLRQSDHFNPFGQGPQSFPRTPIKDNKGNYSNRPLLPDESGVKSPNRTITPNRMGRDDNLTIDRSLPLDANTTYNQDYRFAPLRSRTGTGQVEQKPAASSSVRDSDERSYGRIKSVKYDNVQAVYQDNFKEIPPLYFLKKDCPIEGLPKPPKIIAAGKLHVYYDEEENDWN